MLSLYRFTDSEIAIKEAKKTMSDHFDRLTCRSAEVFSVAVLALGTGFTLALLINPSHITVCAPGTSLPVLTGARWAVVACWTDLTLALKHTVVTRRAGITLDSVGVVHLEKL